MRGAQVVRDRKKVGSRALSHNTTTTTPMPPLLINSFVQRIVFYFRFVLGKQGYAFTCIQ